jgi:hypothetical protein
MKSMSLHVALGKNGLEISVSGELDGFDPVEYAEHRKMGGIELQPLRAFAFQTTFPWAWLTVIGARYADRAAKF